jgi:hypothetical protein
MMLNGLFISWTIFRVLATVGVCGIVNPACLILAVLVDALFPAPRPQRQ